jgi:hypothetical protein
MRRPAQPLRNNNLDFGIPATRLGKYPLNLLASPIVRYRHWLAMITHNADVMNRAMGCRE